MPLVLLVGGEEPLRANPKKGQGAGEHDATPQRSGTANLHFCIQYLTADQLVRNRGVAGEQDCSQRFVFGFFVEKRNKHNFNQLAHVYEQPLLI